MFVDHITPTRATDSCEVRKMLYYMDHYNEFHYLRYRHSEESSIVIKGNAIKGSDLAVPSILRPPGPQPPSLLSRFFTRLQRYR